MTPADSAWDWNSEYWRKLGAPWGGVHSTVGDIARLLQAMLDGGQPILKRDTALQMTSLQTQGLGNPWGLGWRVGADAFYDGSPAQIFGHEGSTGTLCWADPKRQLIFVLFTNRPEANDKSYLLRRVSRLVADAAQ
jgi:CubicO group peptidase (beta-lactamase class C family)